MYFKQTNEPYGIEATLTTLEINHIILILSVGFTNYMKENVNQSSWQSRVR